LNVKRKISESNFDKNLKIVQANAVNLQNGDEKS
jgi:hypothetical protein